jgi:uncharacterized damage-inducible protein DinB
MTGSDAAFLRHSIGFLRDEYLPRIERVLASLPADDLWWRANDDALSAGTILAHLAGNVRQWIVSGLGGEADQRDRAAEFAATTGPEADALFAQLSETVGSACRVIEGLAGKDLGVSVVIQGFETTPIYAVYHVVEHFSWHTGQLLSIVKQRAGPGHGISFYDDATINAAHNEPA